MTYPLVEGVKLSGNNPWWIAICAGLLSGSLSSILAYTLNHNKENSTYRRQKGEELYVAIDQYVLLLLASSTEEISTGCDAEALTDDQIKEMADSYKNIRMLTKIHFPEIDKNTSILFGIRDEIDTLAKSSESQKTKERKMNALHLRLESCSEEARNVVARFSRSGGHLSIVQSISHAFGFSK